MGYPQQASACRQGSFLMIKGHACKITAMSTSKTGKHGHAKCKFTAIDIFDNTKHEMVESSTHNVEIPNVKRTEYQLVNIEDEFIHLMDTESGDVREDIKLPDESGCWAEVGTKISGFFDTEGECMVTVLAAIGKEMAIDAKKCSQ